MSRPLTWYPLAATDPVPGEPASVVSGGQHYSSVAASISTAAERLDQIAELGEMQAEAVEAIRTRARQVAADVRRAHGRYVTVGSALTDYGRALDAAQRDSLAALYAAQSAQHSLDSATDAVRRATLALDEADEPDEIGVRRAQLSRARGQLHEADATIARARADLEAAVDHRDQAAQRAITEIDRATDDGLNDGWWENWGSKVAHALSAVAGLIASVTGILALVLCWVPVLGQALAVVAAIATAVKLVADIALAAHDEGSWADVGWGVFALATFGAGRVLSTAAKIAGQGAQGVARLDAGRQAATSIISRGARGLPTHSSALRTIDELLGREISLASRGTARSLAQQSSSSLIRALARPEPWRSLSPQALIADLRALRGFSFSEGVAQGWSNLQSAWGTAGFLGASQADMGLAQAVSGAAAVSPALRAVAGTTDAAVGATMAANATFGGSVAVGSYDQTVGLQWTTERFTGGDAPIAILTPWREVSQAWAPTAAERLNLP